MDSQGHKPRWWRTSFIHWGQGLENGLVNIINRCPPDRYRHAIICLTQADNFADRIAAAGVDIVELRKQPGTIFLCTGACGGNCTGCVRR